MNYIYIFIVICFIHVEVILFLILLHIYWIYIIVLYHFFIYTLQNKIWWSTYMCWWRLELILVLGELCGILCSCSSTVDYYNGVQYVCWIIVFSRCCSVGPERSLLFINFFCCSEKMHKNDQLQSGLLFNCWTSCLLHANSLPSSFNKFIFFGTIL